MNSQKGFVVPLIIAIVVVLVVGGLYIYENNKTEQQIEQWYHPEDTSTTTIPIVGGDKDEHGCIGSAGYSWCAEKNKCLRVWEEKCEVCAAVGENVYDMASKGPTSCCMGLILKLCEGVCTPSILGKCVMSSN